MNGFSVILLSSRLSSTRLQVSFESRLDLHHWLKYPAHSGWPVLIQRHPWLLSFLVQYLYLVHLAFLMASSLIFSSTITRWWSDPTSALRFTRVSCSELFMATWSIWLSVTPSGDLHVTSCGGKVFHQWQGRWLRRNRRTALRFHWLNLRPGFPWSTPCPCYPTPLWHWDRPLQW